MIVASAALLTGHSAQAVAYTWDSDGVSKGVTGGTGTWDTTSPLWTANGTTYVAWPNAAGNNATLGGTAGTVTLSGANLTVGAASILSFLTTGYTVQSAGTEAFVINTTASFSLLATTNVVATVSTNIQGQVATDSGNLIKTQAGTVILTGANTYSRSTTIQAGFLSVSTINSVVGGSASSNLGAPTSAAFGTISLGSAGTGGTLIYTGAGETTDRILNLAGTTGGGGIQADGSGAVVFSSNLTTTGNGIKILTLSGTSTADNTLQGTIVDGASATSLTKNSAGTWVLNGNSTYTGATKINDGIVSVNSLRNVGSSSSLGAPTTTANGTINLGLTGGTTTGTLKYTGGGDTTDRVINLAGATGGGTLDASGSGALVFTSSFTATGSGIKTLTLQGTNTDGNTIQGAIVDALNNATSVTKNGAGTWILSGSNTYTGATNVTGGTLRVGAFGSLSNATAVTVSGGKLDSNVTSATLGGALTLSGGTLDPNGSSVGSFTLASGKDFTMSSGTFNLQLGASFDSLASAGSAKFTITGGTIALDVTGAGFSYGNTYNVLSNFTGANTVSGLLFTGYDTGGYSASLGTDGTLSFMTIPETESWAMALIGFGILLGTGRLRRKSPRPLSLPL